jgi:hypothetical protein
MLTVVHEGAMASTHVLVQRAETKKKTLGRST